MELNFVFCEWELYVGTAPEQKTENAKKRLGFDAQAIFKNPSVSNDADICYATLLSLRDISPDRGIFFNKGDKRGLNYFIIGVVQPILSTV